MKSKIDVVKVVTVTASVLGIAGTLLSGWAGQKQNEATIEKKIAEALSKNQSGES